MFLEKSKKYFEASRMVNVWQHGAGLLLFSFPLLGLHVRHWASASFIIMAIAGILLLVNKGSGLLKELEAAERYILVSFVLFFISYLFTSTAAGWDYGAVRAFPTEIRFLLVIPILIFVYNIRSAMQFFFWGSVGGFFISVAYVFEGAIIKDVQRDFLGVYGPLYLAPGTLILAAIIYFGADYYIRKTGYKIALKIFILSGAAFVSSYTSRISFIAAMILIVTCFLYEVRKTSMRAMGVVALVISFIFLGYLHEPTKLRFALLADEVSEYIYSSNDKQDLPEVGNESSFAVRANMYEAAVFVIKTNPIFGLGRYNYTAYVEGLVDQGKLPQSVMRHGHPHNIFLAALFFKGLIGLTVLFLMIFFIYRKFIETRMESFRNLRFMGISFLLVLLISQLAESAVLIKGNFISLFIVTTVVILAALRQRRDTTAV